MPSRLNPWPSFVDLFSALLVAFFAGFIMLSSSYKQEHEEKERVKGEITKIRQEANKITEKLHKSLEGSGLKGKVSPCGEDTCIHLDIHFITDEDKIYSQDEINAIKDICAIIKQGLDHLPPDQRKDVEIVIEGHTDNKQISASYGDRAQYLYNWNLSAQRATSVLYEFRNCGLQPPDYQIVAIGYADSVPLCKEDNEECNKQNRRTTLRLRVDTHRIEERLSQNKN